MQNSKETRKTSRGQFGWLYKVLCEEKQVKPLLAVQAYLKENCLRFSVDRVGLKDWSPILNSIADNRSLSKVYIYSRSHCRKIREKINTEEKLEKLWRCGGVEGTWPILYTNFLLRCLVDSVAVFARDSSSVTSLILDGIPLAPKYLNILCSGLRINWSLTHLSLTKCHIGDVGCGLLLDCLRNTPCLSVLNLSSCHLTNRCAMSLSLFLKRRKADLLQNVWEECSSLQSQEGHSDKKPQGLHTLILNKNPKFGDTGIRQVLHALKSDMWLKSLNLRRCGITKHGAEAVIEVLGSNSVIMNMDLTENHIPINTLQGILRTLKRRRELAESKSMKKRFLLNWNDVSLRKMLKKNEMKRSVFGGPKNLINPSKRVNGNSLRVHRLKRIQRFTERRFKQTKEEQSTKKKDTLEKKKNLHELKSQLLNVISSNSKLEEQLSSNKALFDTAVQERSRTEDELQKVSLQLNDLRSKVIMLNCLRSKVCGESQLLKGLRDVFDKFEVFSSAKNVDDVDECQEVIVIDREPEILLLK